MGPLGLSVTLANSIIGVGILAMPFCFQQCGVLLATLMLLLMGLVSRLSCYYLLKSAIIARRRNFEFLAFHVFGPAGKMTVELGIIGFLMGTCIAYFVVVGDLGPQIISKMFNINQSDILRTCIMVVVSLVCVLPLGLLRNVDSLSNVSAATIGFYFCLVMKVILEAATQLLTGDWYQRVEMWRPAGLLQCLPILSMALFCQTQLFEVFESMPSLSLEKMNLVTKNAINICSCVYLTLGIFGYIAFSSQNISGNILMSLSPTWGSDVIKLGFVMSLAFSFPLIIFPCRASLYSFLYRKVHPAHHDHIINHSIPETTFRCITVAIIAITLFISLLLPNVELVLGLVGSTIGVLICVVFPAACFINVTFKNTNERVLAKFTLALGLCILVLGTYANLQAAENQKEKYDDRFTQEKIDKIVEEFFEAKKLEREKDTNGIIKKIDDKPKNVIINVEMKEYKVQPPNPVPPDSKVIEEIQQNVETKENKPILKEVNKPILKELNKPAVDIESVVDQLIEPENKIALNPIQPDLLVPVENGHPNDDLVKAEDAVLKQEVKLQEKIDMIKHQKLIETIKQHGEEQKELLKEQQEILSEIKKTKEEISKNKKEADSKEAQKIVVESIQKIANAAIQSLSGVTDKPGPINVNKDDKPLEEIRNDAVLDIAKKAVETIEAIKEIKDKPMGVVESQPKIELDAIKVLPQANIAEQKSDALPDQNVPILDQKDQKFINKDEIPNIDKIKSEIVAQDQNDQKFINKDQIPKIDKIESEKVAQDQKFINKDQIPNIDKIESEKIAQENVIAMKPNNVIPQQNVVLNKQVPAVNKEHLHSPDEPKSYKEGEDAQKIKFDLNLNQNVPIAVAMSSNVQKVAEIKLANEINAPNDETRRKKREVIDCTNINSLKQEDKLICTTLVTQNHDVSVKDVLAKVDLNEALNRQPLDVSNFRIRSLKSMKEEKKIVF